MGKKIKCTIDEVKFKDKNFLSPIIVTFQHGELLPEKAETLKCSVLSDKKRKCRDFTLSSGLSTISYKGSPSIDYKDTCRTMLAIRNSKTNKIRLIESEMMILAPCINKEAKKSENFNLSYSDKMHNLAHTFGSKRGKRINEQRERSKTDNTELNEDLKETLDTVDVSFRESKQDCAAAGIPWNRDAKRVEDVYKLYDLISKEQLKSLKQEARHVKNASKELLESKYSSFLVRTLPLVLERNVKDKKQLKQDLELLVYIDYLIMHTKCNFNKPFADTEKLCTVSSSVNKKLIEEFSLPGAGNTRLCTTVIKDKASCHVIVLSLLLLNYQVCLKQLATALNHTIIKLKTFSHALGAHCAKDSSLAVLRVPLVVPKQRVIGKMKKR